MTSKTILTTLLILLTTTCVVAPVASAGPSCPQRYGENTPGTGSVKYNGIWYDIDHVTWVDGCGRNGCDDSISGTIYLGGTPYRFTVAEISGSKDDCGLQCQVDDVVYGGHGWVVPSDQNSVYFTCYGDGGNYDLEYGTASGADASSYAARISYVLPL